MPAPRFFVDLPLAAGQSLALPDAVAHHALRVLRLADGSAITLFDGRGGEYAARLTIDGKRATAHIERFDPVERESPLDLTLVQSWVATDKLDWIVEKAVELGARRIVFTPAERSVVRLTGERQARRLAHLTLLAQAACAQCGRNRVPALRAADTLAAALVAGGDAPLLMLLPTADETLDRIATTAAARLLVGPEGGFTEHEIATARAAGARAIRLGPRVLRTETAGLAALAALQAVAGDLRG